MKTKLSKTGVLALSLAFLSPVVTQAADASSDSWRTNMESFVEEVLAVAQKSTLPPEDAWTRSGLKRLGTVLGKKGIGTTGVIPHATGMYGELSTELLKRFPGGTVSWQGVVKSTTNNTDRAVHIIEVAFPPHKGCVKIQPVRLEIPLAAMPCDQSPVAGDTFAFTGTLKGKKEDMLFQEGVEVVYWFAASEERGNQFVFVSLSDVTPATKTK